jgi:predicted O-linked N-acetylglucosamine transferase (SPINDLY family)/glycosyltransferase involved in cell wall biosynthesis
MSPGELMALAEQLASSGAQTRAREVYEAWLAATTSPLAYIIRFNLAVICGNLDDLPAAESHYRAAIFAKPDFVQAWFNLGTVIERQGRKPQALVIWQSMVDHPLVAPDRERDMYLMVRNNMGRVCEDLREFRQAEQHLEASLRCDPDQPKVIQHWVHLRQKQCSWPVFGSLPAPDPNELLKWTSPLAMLSATDDPGLQLATAQRFVKERVNQRVTDLSPKTPYRHDRLRVAFLSSDFCLHAVSLLTVELFELLDRSKFEVWGFCWSREDGSDLRKRVIAAFDHFISIKTMSDEAAAIAIREAEIDILIDLQGITSGARPDILSYRPAPTQMTYLGFPGSTGHPCIDYVIGDRFLIPPDVSPYYSEKPAYIDKVFQCSDRKRPIGVLPTRAQCGLPEDAFVYCSFNNNYKFTPEVFDCWLRILQQVPESVLWLLADNQWSQAALTDRARAAGIDTARLIFAPRVAPPDYLARYTVADLFLDTYPFNAGTTANDALWMGLPVLTRSGKPFASRMAGALLHAAGLDSLITHDLGAYETRAVALGRDRDQAKALRAHLGSLPARYALFDMPSFVAAFGAMLMRVLEPAKADEAKTHRPATGSGDNPTSAESASHPRPVRHSRRFRLLVRGWRGINHSYALVNQYQLAELARHPDVELMHEDLPTLVDWRPTPMGSGLREDLRLLVDGVPRYDGRPVDASYSIASPPRLWQGKARSHFSYLVTEFGPAPDSWGGAAPADFTATHRHVVTPSLWARDKYIGCGMSPERIHVVPHGVDKERFRPLSTKARDAARAQLGIAPNEFALLNVGGAFWNKGIDLLVRAFAELGRHHSHLRLILKDNRALYGRSSDDIVGAVRAQHPDLLDVDAIGRIVSVPGTLDTDQLALLYNAADLYVSPYRAEGFNLPVIEAMACGLRVVVTAGGATDDFFLQQGGRKVAAIRVSPQSSTLPVHGDFLEPDMADLVATIAEEIATPARSDVYGLVKGWDAVTGSLLSALIDHAGHTARER